MEVLGCFRLLQDSFRAVEYEHGNVFLFDRFGNVPCLDDLEDGLNMLHVQLLVLLPRYAPGASDGVFDLLGKWITSVLVLCMCGLSCGIEG